MYIQCLYTVTGILICVYVIPVQVTDPDLGDSSVVVYSILTDDAPFEVDSVEGYMTSAGDFSGLSGTRYEVLVEARDNGGIDPFLAFNNTAVVRQHTA